MRDSDFRDIADQATWSKVADAVRQLEVSWQAGSPIEFAGLLPAPQDADRVRVLVELIKVDQEFRCESGQVKLTDAYLADWPELVQSDAAVVELFRSECLTRALMGAAPADHEVCQRLHARPDLIARIDLPEIMARAKAEQAADGTEPEDTPRDSQDQTQRAGPASHEYPLGGTLGDYEIRRKLGQGGMGAVYVAYHPQLDCEVAIKVPRLDPVYHTEIVQRFLREGRALAKVRHPHVCSIYDADTNDSTYFIVMELIDGQSLAKMIEAGPISCRDAAEIVRKTALGLAAVHEAGIIHRDVRPHNIMIDKQGEPRLMDFGLAREADGPSDLTSHNAMIGAPAYMSPAQVNGEPLDARSDIYSLGVTLYHALAGRPPFTGSLTQVLADIGHTEPVPLRILRPDVDVQLCAICSKAMAKRPGDRYQSATQMAQALQQWQTDPHTIPSSVRRTWTSRLVIAGAVVVLVGVLAGTLWKTIVAPSRPSPVVGWGLPRCDLAGTRFHPVPTKVPLEKLHINEVWSFPGDTALTGDINGDGVLELLIGNGTDVAAWNSVQTTDGTPAMNCLWEETGAGHLDVVADVTGDASAEIITSKADGDRLVLRVLDGHGDELVQFNADGEFDPDEKVYNNKAIMYGYGVADLEQDGDKEIIAVKTMESGTHSRRVVTFNFPSRFLREYESIGPMVSDISIGRTPSFNDDFTLLYATEGPNDEKRKGEDDSRGDQCYVYCHRGKLGKPLWRYSCDGNGHMAARVGLVDLDDDGKLDIVASSCRGGGDQIGAGEPREYGSVCLLDPTKGEPRRGYEHDFDGQVYYLGAADFEGKGTKAILVCVTNTVQRTASLMILNPVEGLPEMRTFSVPEPGQTLEHTCALNDLNGDGLPEVVAIVHRTAEDLTADILYVLDARLIELSRWGPYRRLMNPIISDLDGDGINEVIIRRDQEIVVLTVLSR